MTWYRVDVKEPTVDVLAVISGTTVFDYADLKSRSATIPPYVFYGCTYIRDVISTDVTKVDTYAFSGCANVRNISLPNCTNVNGGAFACTRPSSSTTSVLISLPACTYMGNSAFNGFGGNDATAELEFPELITMGIGVFGSSSSTNALTVKSISLPKVQTMGSNCFQRVTADTISLGEDVTNLGSTPFSNATIGEFICMATTPPTLGSNSGLGNAPTVIYVPDANVTDYQTTNRWSQYSSIIKGISERPT